MPPKKEALPQLVKNALNALKSLGVEHHPYHENDFESLKRYILASAQEEFQELPAKNKKHWKLNFFRFKQIRHHALLITGNTFTLEEPKGIYNKTTSALKKYWQSLFLKAEYDELKKQKNIEPPIAIYKLACAVFLQISVFVCSQTLQLSYFSKGMLITKENSANFKPAIKAIKEELNSLNDAQENALLLILAELIEENGLPAHWLDSVDKLALTYNQKIKQLTPKQALSIDELRKLEVNSNRKAETFSERLQNLSFHYLMLYWSAFLPSQAKLTDHFLQILKGAPTFILTVMPDPLREKWIAASFKLEKEIQRLQLGPNGAKLIRDSHKHLNPAPSKKDMLISDYERSLSFVSNVLSNCFGQGNLSDKQLASLSRNMLMLFGYVRALFFRNASTQEAHSSLIEPAIHNSYRFALQLFCHFRQNPLLNPQRASLFAIMYITGTEKLPKANILKWYTTFFHFYTEGYLPQDPDQLYQLTVDAREVIAAAHNIQYSQDINAALALSDQALLESPIKPSTKTWRNQLAMMLSNSAINKDLFKQRIIALLADIKSKNEQINPSDFFAYINRYIINQPLQVAENTWVKLPPIQSSVKLPEDTFAEDLFAIAHRLPAEGYNEATLLQPIRTTVLSANLASSFSKTSEEHPRPQGAISGLKVVKQTQQPWLSSSVPASRRDSESSNSAESAHSAPAALQNYSDESDEQKFPTL